MLVFKINSHVTAGQGSALERFFGHIVGTYQMELFKKKINHAQKSADRLGRCSKDDFRVGDRVLCQDMKSMKWTIKGEVIESRKAEDGSVCSFIIRTEMGRTTLRNARHIKFQAQVPKRVSFADTDSGSDEAAGMSVGTDEAAEIALETDAREPRVSARLAALTANCRLL